MTGFGCGTSPEGPKMAHTFYYPMVKSSLFSICKRQTAHTKVIWYAKNDGGVYMPIRCVFSVIGFGDDTSPQWRPAGPVGLIIFFAKFEKKIVFRKIILNVQCKCQNGTLRVFDRSEHVVLCETGWIYLRTL